MIIEIITSELDFWIIEKVREARLKQTPKVDQVELAHRIGVSESYVGSVESLRKDKKYNIRMLGRIMKALNLKSYSEILPSHVVVNDLVRIRLELLKLNAHAHGVGENGEVSKRFNVISMVPLTEEELELWKLKGLKYLTVVG